MFVRLEYPQLWLICGSPAHEAAGTLDGHYSYRTALLSAARMQYDNHGAGMVPGHSLRLIVPGVSYLSLNMIRKKIAMAGTAVDPAALNAVR